VESGIDTGKEVVANDGRKIGRITAVRDDCVLVETGHVFKATHAIPAMFVHGDDAAVRATVSKEVVMDSPKVEDESWEVHAVLLHYGLEGPFEVDPDPDATETADAVGARAGVEPASLERTRIREHEQRRSHPDGAPVGDFDDRKD
jgi:hypothetical protein